MDNNHEIFDDYVMKFDFSDVKIKYKYNHSYRVMDECKKISESLGFDDDGILLSMVIGLFHDIGRFKQLKMYNTFNDIDSTDHALVSCDVLFKENLIDELEIPKNSEEVISKAIFNHNKLKYDDSDYDEVEKIFCNIVRDADKIDILRSVEAILNINSFEDGSVSKEVRKSFFDNNFVDKSDVKCKLDFIVMIMSLVFDINYEYSKNLIFKEKLIDKIYKLINDKSLCEYKDFVNEYLKKELNNVR